MTAELAVKRLGQFQHQREVIKTYFRTLVLLSDIVVVCIPVCVCMNWIK